LVFAFSILALFMFSLYKYSCSIYSEDYIEPIVFEKLKMFKHSFGVALFSFVASVVIWYVALFVTGVMGAMICRFIWFEVVPVSIRPICALFAFSLSVIAHIIFYKKYSKNPSFVFLVNSNPLRALTLWASGFVLGVHLFIRTYMNLDVPLHYTYVLAFAFMFATIGFSILRLAPMLRACKQCSGWAVSVLGKGGRYPQENFNSHKEWIAAENALVSKYTNLPAFDIIW